MSNLNKIRDLERIEKNIETVEKILLDLNSTYLKNNDFLIKIDEDFNSGIYNKKTTDFYFTLSKPILIQTLNSELQLLIDKSNSLIKDFIER